MKKFLAILLCLVLVCAFASCGGKETKNADTTEADTTKADIVDTDTTEADTTEADTTEAAQVVLNEAASFVDAQFAALKAGDFEALYEIDSEAAYTLEELETDIDFTLMVKDFDYKILGTDADDFGSAFVEMEITNNDFTGLLDTVINELVLWTEENADAVETMTEEEGMALVSGIFEDALVNMESHAVTTTLKLELVKMDDSWVVYESSENLAEAMFPGLATMTVDDADITE